MSKVRYRIFLSAWCIAMVLEKGKELGVLIIFACCCLKEEERLPFIHLDPDGENELSNNMCKRSFSPHSEHVTTRLHGLFGIIWLRIMDIYIHIFQATPLYAHVLSTNCKGRRFFVCCTSCWILHIRLQYMFVKSKDMAAIFFHVFLSRENGCEYLEHTWFHSNILEVYYNCNGDNLSHMTDPIGLTESTVWHVIFLGPLLTKAAGGILT